MRLTYAFDIGTAYARAHVTSGATYQFRLVAINGGGLSYGSNLSFTTPGMTPPVIGDIARLGDGSFQLSFANAPGASFTVLASTNVALPLSNWTVLGAATEIAPGSYRFIDPQAANSPVKFYGVRAP